MTILGLELAVFLLICLSGVLAIALLCTVVCMCRAQTRAQQKQLELEKRVQLAQARAGELARDRALERGVPRAGSPLANSPAAGGRRTPPLESSSRRAWSPSAGSAPPPDAPPVPRVPDGSWSVEGDEEEWAYFNISVGDGDGGEPLRLKLEADRPLCCLFDHSSLVPLSDRHPDLQLVRHGAALDLNATPRDAGIGLTPDSAAAVTVRVPPARAPPPAAAPPSSGTEQGRWNGDEGPVWRAADPRLGPSAGSVTTPPPSPPGRPRSKAISPRAGARPPPPAPPEDQRSHPAPAHPRWVVPVSPQSAHRPEPPRRFDAVSPVAPRYRSTSRPEGDDGGSWAVRRSETPQQGGEAVLLSHALEEEGEVDEFERVPTPLQWCPNDGQCWEVNNEEHYTCFRHYCRIPGCDRRGDPEHDRFFCHAAAIADPRAPSRKVVDTSPVFSGAGPRVVAQHSVDSSRGMGYQLHPNSSECTAASFTYGDNRRW